MEFLTDSLREVLTKLSENNKEEIDVIESIVFTNSGNKENTKEKVIRFIEKRKPENHIRFILDCICLAANVRPKERDSHLFLLTSVFDNFHLNYEKVPLSAIFRDMLKVKNIMPFDHRKTNEHVFDFAEEGTVGRAIFDDDIDSLKQILMIQPRRYIKELFKLTEFHISVFSEIRKNVNRIELAAFFGSVKCFKYLMMSGDEINEDTCMYAVAGGNNEIIHLCEQKGLAFEDCLIIASGFHRFEIFEWLNTHFNYKTIPLSKFIRFSNEPLFYFYSLSGSNVEAKDENGFSSLNHASLLGQFEVVKYLCETCHADVKTRDRDGRTPISNASLKGRLDIVKYLHETCHVNVETKDLYSGCTTINFASWNGKLEVVKYLYETCHANVETKDKSGCTPINNASSNGHLDVVKYLYEICHADVETRDKDGFTPIIWASYKGHLNVVKYLYETCNADVETRDNDGFTPIIHATQNGHREVVKYLHEVCHEDAEEEEDNNSHINFSRMYFY